MVRQAKEAVAYATREPTKELGGLRHGRDNSQLARGLCPLVGGRRNHGIACLFGSFGREHHHRKKLGEEVTPELAADLTDMRLEADLMLALEWIEEA